MLRPLSLLMCFHLAVLAAEDAPLALTPIGAAAGTMTVMWNPAVDADVVEEAADAQFSSVTRAVPVAGGRLTLAGFLPRQPRWLRLRTKDGRTGEVVRVLTTMRPAVEGPNLLPINPGFEDGVVGARGHGGDGAIPGWDRHYLAWASGAAVVDGGASEGRRRFVLPHGGWLRTKADNAAPVIAGRSYQLAIDACKSRDQQPQCWDGFSVRVSFAGRDGQEILALPLGMQQMSGPFPWETFTWDLIPPPGATTMAIAIEVSRGAYPREDFKDFSFDNVRVIALPLVADEVRVRQAPRCLTAGASSRLVVRQNATQASAVVVRLMHGDQVFAEARTAVDRGHSQAELAVGIPAELPPGDDYRWDIAVVPRAGTLATATARTAVPGVFLALQGEGDAEIPANHPRLRLIGRWDRSEPTAPLQFWGGSQIRARFQGTTLAVRMDVPADAWNVAIDHRVVIDGDESRPQFFTVKQGGPAEQLLASGLSQGIHEVVISRESEAHAAPLTFRGLRLDPGCGLLRGEPVQRRIEFYGDSITSGGNAGEPKRSDANPHVEADWKGSIYWTYAWQTARALGAEAHLISKGGTGIRGGFAHIQGGDFYWDRCEYTVWKAGKAWDFPAWKPDAVVIAWGHNDQFVDPDWVSSLRWIHGELRRVYGPTVPIFITNTTMTDANFWNRAASPLQWSDPQVYFSTFATQPFGGHPTHPYHTWMATGGPQYLGLSDRIGNVLGW